MSLGYKRKWLPFWAKNKWEQFPHVIQTHTKFLNFVRLYFQHFTSFCTRLCNFPNFTPSFLAIIFTYSTLSRLKFSLLCIFQNIKILGPLFHDVTLDLPLVSQVFPLQPWGHSHIHFNTPTTHLPPFLHGLGVQPCSDIEKYLNIVKQTRIRRVYKLRRHPLQFYRLL